MFPLSHFMNNWTSWRIWQSWILMFPFNSSNTGPPSPGFHHYGSVLSPTRYQLFLYCSLWFLLQCDFCWPYVTLLISWLLAILVISNRNWSKERGMICGGWMKQKKKKKPKKNRWWARDLGHRNQWAGLAEVANLQLFSYIVFLSSHSDI